MSGTRNGVRRVDISRSMSTTSQRRSDAYSLVSPLGDPEQRMTLGPLPIWGSRPRTAQARNRAPSGHGGTSLVPVVPGPSPLFISIPGGDKGVKGEKGEEWKRFSKKAGTSGTRRGPQARNRD